MSDINKDLLINEQYYTSRKGPLDSKLTPADSYAELIDMTRIPRAQRYVGLTVTVLNAGSGSPVEYWLVGGTTNASWKIKTGNVVPNKAALLALSSSACTLGLEMVVQADETNDNKVTKYWVTNLSPLTWEQKTYANVSITGEDQEH